MKQVNLRKGMGGHTHVLLSEIAGLSARGGRIFRMTVVGEKPGEVKRLVTTSKDIYLKIGEMSEKAKWALACLLEENFDDTGDVFLAREIPDAAPDVEGLLYASKVTLLGGHVIHLSSV